MYHHFDNINLIGYRMGGGKSDNIIITDIYSNTVINKLVAINGNGPTYSWEIV